MSDGDPAIREARRFLRRSLVGAMAFDEHVRPIKLVIAPDGRLVAPVMVGMIEAADTVIFLPEESDDALQIQVTLEPFDEHGPLGSLADRWRIYHGEPPDVRWAILTPEAARLGEIFLDGEAIVIPNPLAAVEARICRTINERHLDLLSSSCLRVHSKALENPRAVGIDDGGIDVRGRFDVFRLEAIRPLTSEADAIAMLSEV
jgi:hypothetical protein